MTDTATVDKVLSGQEVNSAEPVAAHRFDSEGRHSVNDKAIHNASAPVKPASPPVKPASPHPQNRKRKAGKSENGSDKQHQPKKKTFQYGNYNQYYGYRNVGIQDDSRLKFFKREWFQGKTVLDIGCNAGHVTLFIAKHWRPARIVGMDIDAGLIYTARQNVKHYHSNMSTQEENCDHDNPAPSQSVEDAGQETGLRKNDGEGGDSTVEMSIPNLVSGAEMHENPLDVPPEVHDETHSTVPHTSEGPVSAPLSPITLPNPPGNFPENICFVRANYVLDNDQLLVTQREEYDVIMCLSVTKWIHLNWGDVGLKRLFRRVYKHLLPGGMFVLEPQPWNSYGRRKKLTDTISKHYKSIQLMPERFASYLTSEVGFSSCELIGTPRNSSQGFERPIYVLRKGHTPPKEVA